MLLFELRPQLKTSTKRVQVPNIRNSTPLGAGIQGFASSLKRHPNTIVKIALTADIDAYAEFIRLALAHQDNPFFPKIKSVKRYRIDVLSEDEYDELMASIGVRPPQSPNNTMLDYFKWMIIIVMEKLRPIENIQFPKGYFVKLFGKGAISALSPDYTEDWFDRIRFVTRIIGDRGQLISKSTPNRYLKDILRLMRPMWNKWMVDTKADNIMVRETPQGPQLVFIDPVWSHPAISNGGLEVTFDYS